MRQYKARSIDPVFPRTTEKPHGIPRDGYLLGQYHNSDSPEYKVRVSITREQHKLYVTSCGLPIFRRTTPLNM